jgi:hypothetical protein
MKPVPHHGGWWVGLTTIRDSGGPVRVDTDKEDKTFTRRPVGFTANLEERVKDVSSGPAADAAQPEPEDGPQLSLF